MLNEAGLLTGWLKLLLVGKLGWCVVLFSDYYSFVDFQLRAMEEGLTSNHTKFSGIYDFGVYAAGGTNSYSPLFPRYVWTQTLGELSVTVPVPPGTKSRDVVSRGGHVC